MILAAAMAGSSAWVPLFILTIIGIIFFIAVCARFFGIYGLLFSALASVLACAILAAHYAMH